MDLNELLRRAVEANPSHAELSHAEWLGLLLDRETTERHDRRLRARLRHARLRHQAVVEDVDYRAARGLDRALFQSLAGGRWIEEAQNLIIEGPTGVGKSWLACALGQKACRDNRSVLYQRVPKMFADLALGRGDGRYPRLMRAITGVKLRIHRVHLALRRALGIPLAPTAPARGAARRITASLRTATPSSDIRLPRCMRRCYAKPT